MDGDARVEPQLDSFSLTFPLPFRIGFLVTLAVWGWGLNLHGLRAARIDVPSLLQYPGRASPHHPSHHLSTYRFATVFSALLFGAMTFFWLLTRRDPSLVASHDWVPMLYLAALAALFVVPLRRSLPGRGRRRLLTTLRRVSIGGIAEARDGKFGDILLTDALTSYAKVLGDVFVALCMFLLPGRSATAAPDRSCGGAVAVPLMMALPSLLRLRQCLIEYRRVRDASHREAGSGWGGQHLANALKYATAFPVILTSSLQRNAEMTGMGSTSLYRAWLAAVTVNSLYSFYWDVTKDWDLTVLAPAKQERSLVGRGTVAWGLRERLVFRLPGLYYGVVGMDLVLRLAWSMKLSPHLDRFSRWEGGIFVVELLEVFRRWVWVFFRTEAEWIRGGESAGPGLDEVLLGDYEVSGEGSDEDF